MGIFKRLQKKNLLGLFIAFGTCFLLNCHLAPEKELVVEEAEGVLAPGCAGSKNLPNGCYCSEASQCSSSNCIKITSDIKKNGFQTCAVPLNHGGYSPHACIEELNSPVSKNATGICVDSFYADKAWKLNECCESWDQSACKSYPYLCEMGNCGCTPGDCSSAATVTLSQCNKALVNSYCAGPVDKNPSACDQVGCFALLANTYQQKLRCDIYLETCVFGDLKTAKSNPLCGISDIPAGYVHGKNISAEQYNNIVGVNIEAIDKIICLVESKSALQWDVNMMQTVPFPPDISSFKEYALDKCARPGVTWAKYFNLNGCKKTLPNGPPSDVISLDTIYACMVENGFVSDFATGRSKAGFLKQVKSGSDIQAMFIAACRARTDGLLAFFEQLYGVVGAKETSAIIGSSTINSLSNTAVNCVVGPYQNAFSAETPTLNAANWETVTPFQDKFAPIVKNICSDPANAKCGASSGTKYFSCNVPTLSNQQAEQQMNSYINNICCPITEALGVTFPSCAE